MNEYGECVDGELSWMNELIDGWAVRWSMVQKGPKKNIVCFRFPTDPIKTCATQIYLIDFQIFFFFFFFFFFLGNP